jgi:hypothetical protein
MAALARKKSRRSEGGGARVREEGQRGEIDHHEESVEEALCFGWILGPRA